MIIFDHKSSNLITKLTPPLTFLCLPHTRLSEFISSYLHLPPAPGRVVTRGDYVDYEGTNQDNSQYITGPVEGLVTRSIPLLVLVVFFCMLFVNDKSIVKQVH